LIIYNISFFAYISSAQQQVAVLATLANLRVIATTPSKEDNRLHVKCITFSQPPVGNAALRELF
jgi:hypothetical protein